MSRPLQRRDAAFTRAHSIGPSMTPMVDVVLVILIFFMASTTFIGPEWLLRSALPRTPTEGAAAPSSGDFTLPPARFDLTLTTDATGATVVRGLGLSAGTVSECVTRIAEYAARLGSDRMAVHLDPAPDVAYSDVVRLHEACAAAGVQNVGLN